MKRIIDSYIKNLFSTIVENCTINNFTISIGIRPEVEIETNLLISYLRSILSNTIYKFD